MKKMAFILVVLGLLLGVGVNHANAMELRLIRSSSLEEVGFGTANFETTLSNRGYVRALDFDNDGVWDCVFIWSRTGKLSVYEHPQYWASSLAVESNGIPEEDWFQGFRDVATGKSMPMKIAGEDIQKVLGIFDKIEIKRIIAHPKEEDAQ